MVNKFIAAWVLLAISATAEGQLNWSMRDARNMASPAVDVPSDLSESRLLWKKKVSTRQYSIPVIENDRIYLGVNDAMLRNDDARRATGGGMILCLEKNTGNEIWKHVVPRFVDKTGSGKFHFNCFQSGICSSPVLDSKQLYVVGSDGSVLCLNKADGTLVWRYDFVEQLKVFPHDVCGSTLLLKDGKIYACTSNGVDEGHRAAINPKAPGLVVLDAETGKLLALADEKISEDVFHGQWSSPAFGTIKGKDLIFFGGGDGRCYAFETLKKRTDKVQTLKRVWVTDCNPRAYRYDANGAKIEPAKWHDRKPTGPNPIIGTTVLYKGRIYVALGQSPYHGPGNGMLNCLDAETGKILWQTDVVKRTTATVAIHDGLLFVSDFSDQLHCIDAETGKSHWVHDLISDVWAASPVVADGKIYVGTSHKYLWILKAGKKKEVLQEIRLSSMPITVVPENGRLYVPTQRSLEVYE